MRSRTGLLPVVHQKQVGAFFGKLLQLVGEAAHAEQHKPFCYTEKYNKIKYNFLDILTNILCD